MSNTFSTIEVDSKFWLAKEPVMDLPELWQYRSNNLEWDEEAFNKDYLAYNLWKSGWIEIKEEHAGEFKGRTGLIEDVDFVVGTKPENYLREGQSLRQAFPINTDQGRIVAVPIGEDDVWEEVKNLLYSDTCVPPIYVTAVFDYLKKKSFTIKRKV
jgi:hypothetical protein